MSAKIISIIVILFLSSQLFGGGVVCCVVIDNEDSTGYSEFGEWHTSVVTAHGTSSRFAALHSNLLASYQFKTTFEKSGKYDVYELLPKTVNSTDNALYVFSIGNIVLDSLEFLQNKDYLKC